MSKLTLAALEDIGYVVDPSTVRRDIVVHVPPAGHRRRSTAW